MKEIFCAKCGTKARSGDVFCSHCGNKLETKNVEDEEIVVDAEVIEDEEESSNQENRQENNYSSDQENRQGNNYSSNQESSHRNDDSRNYKNYRGKQIFDRDVNGINRVIINSSVNRIRVGVSNDDRIHVIWQDSKLRHTKVYTQGDSLYVEEETVVTIMEIFGLIELKQNNEVMIMLPQYFPGNISIENLNEVVSMENINIMGSIEVRSKTGQVYMSNCAFDNGDINCESCAITLNAIDPGNYLSCMTKNGQVTISLRRGAECYTIDAQSNHGSINGRPAMHGGIPMPNYQEGYGPVRVLVTTVTGNIRYCFGR